MERDNFEDLDVNCKIILEWNLKKSGCEGVNFIDVAQDKDKKMAFMNAVMNLWVL